MSRRKVWAHRIYLESLCHDHSSFLTLTYDPAIYDGATLVPRHLQLFFKRLRKALAPQSIRYFAVGEYGDENKRPHYHAALFGVPYNDPSVLEIVRSAWGMGHVMLAELNPKTAKYICGYVTKKFSVKEPPPGCIPEFSRMSNRPGIGALSIPDMAAVLLSVENGRYVALQEDVPTSLEMDGRPFPLGRYLRRKLREELGLPPGAPSSVLQKWQEEMRSLCEAHLGPPSFNNPWSKTRVRDLLVSLNVGTVANMTAKFKLLEKKRTL